MLHRTGAGIETKISGHPIEDARIGFPGHPINGATDVPNRALYFTIVWASAPFGSRKTATTRAVAELERMRLAPELDAERIEELKRGIPVADAMTEFSSDKPLLPRPEDPLLGNKLDSMAGTTDYLIGKLNKKYSELMGRPRK